MSVIVAASQRSNVSVWVAFILLIVGTLGAYQIVGLNQALLFFDWRCFGDDLVSCFFWLYF